MSSILFGRGDTETEGVELDGPEGRSRFLSQLRGELTISSSYMRYEEAIQSKRLHLSQPNSSSLRSAQRQLLACTVNTHVVCYYEGYR